MVAKNRPKLDLDGRRFPRGTNGDAWVWGFLRAVLATIVDFDEAVKIVDVLQETRRSGR